MKTSATRQRFKRVFYHYEKLEEYHYGMWRFVTGEQRWPFHKAAVLLMKDAPAFKKAMLRAVEEWPYSCEMNLTAPLVNHQAWIGHAGCCLVTGSPEDITRQAWHVLTKAEQDLANAMADEVIAIWCARYLEKMACAEKTPRNQCIDGDKSADRLDL